MRVAYRSFAYEQAQFGSPLHTLWQKQVLSPTLATTRLSQRWGTRYGLVLGVGYPPEPGTDDREKTSAEKCQAGWFRYGVA
jgi:hypothetical protein